MIYNEEANTVVEGFGVTPERHTELQENYFHGSRGDCLGRICNDESLPPNEKCLLLVTLGGKIMEQYLVEKAEEINSMLAKNGK